MSLTDLACRQAKPKSKQYKLCDTGGLYINVRPSGGKFWRMKYQYLGKAKVLSFGAYPLVSLSLAREKRDKARLQLIEGIDPSYEKREQKRLLVYNNAQTFQLIAEQWHSRFYSTWTERYAQQIMLRLKANVFPYIGHKQLSLVTVQDVIQCLSKIEERGAYDLTRRILRIIGQIMRYGVITGRAERDITPDLKDSLIKHKSGHFASISPDELPEFVKTLYSNKARLFPQTLYAVKLLLLTFVRTVELIEATWDEFDFDKKIWTIPPERMKMKKQHIVPLSRQAIALLLEMKEIWGHKKYILPSICKSTKPISNNTILKALARMGYEYRMTGHGFRSLAMSTIKENFSYRHEVIDRQLAHVPNNKVDKAYDRASFLPQRITMMQDWADYIDNAIAL